MFGRQSKMKTGLLIFCIVQAFFVCYVSAETNSTADSPKALFESIGHYTVGRSMLASMAIVLGAVVTISGFRLFRPTMFLCAFLVGGVVISGIAQAACDGRNGVETATWIAFFVGGLVTAGIVICVYNVGLFLVGAAAGIVLAATLNNSFGYKISSSEPTIVFILLAVALGALGGAITCRAERAIIIIMTSLVGSQVFIWGAGFFIGKYPNPVDLKYLATQTANGHWKYNIPKEWWGYVAAMIITFFIGVYVQFHRSNRDANYHVGARRFGAVPKNDDIQTPTPYTGLATPQTKYGDPVTHV